MSRRSALRRRSRQEWALRCAVAAVAAALAYVSVMQTLAQTVARKDAALGHRLAPGNGRIAARLAMSLSGVEATAADRARADVLARKALLRDATAVSAVTTLGVNAEIGRDRTRARRLFNYAQKLSRRDLPTQFWAIEDAVGRGDVPGALHHYDIALRTNSATTADALYPILASASTDPEIRAALVKKLAARPNWGESFIAYLAGRGPDPRSTAALFVSLQRAGVAVPESARTPIINTLIGGDWIDEAWRFYASANPGVDRRVSRDPRFAAGREVPSFFDWMPIDGGGMFASIQRGSEGGVFDFVAPASVGGPLLQQMQLLPSGVYRIAGHGSGIEQEESSRPYWVLSCRRDGRELGRVAMPNSTEADGRFTGTFVVPANCPVQVLMLMARPSDAVEGLSGRIDHVQLMPVR